MDGEKAPGGTVARLPSVHEQEDGTILAVCATGSSSRDSLLSWVRRLEVDLQYFSFLFQDSLEENPVCATGFSSRDSTIHTLVGSILCPQAESGRKVNLT